MRVTLPQIQVCMTRTETNSRADAVTDEAVTGQAGLLSAVTLLARELNAATTIAGAYQSAMRGLSGLIPSDLLCATCSTEEGNQQLCAKLERGGEVSFVSDGEPEIVAQAMMELAVETNLPVIFNQVQTELGSGSLSLPLVCADAQSVLLAPLPQGETLAGVLIISHSRIAAYTQTDADAAGLVASLLASALSRIQLAARIAEAQERDAARQRVEALVEILRQAAHSSFDVNQIIQHAIEALGRCSLLPASFIVLRSVAFGRPEQILRAWTQGHDRPPLELNAPISKEERMVYAERRAVFIEDARALGQISSELRPLVERLGARSIYLAPVVYGGQALAAIGLVESDRQRRWTPEEQLLLARVAETIAPLILNAQLHALSRIYIEDLSTLLRLAADVTSDVDLERVLRAVLGSWSKIMGTESNAILSWDEEAKRFRLAIGEQLPASLSEKYRQGVTLDDPVCGLAATRRTGVVADLAGDTRFAELYSAVQWSGLRGMRATPVIGRMNQVLGMLVSFSSAAVEGSPDEQRLADLLTRPVALAMQNLEAGRQQRALSNKVAQLKENLSRADQYKTEFMAIISHELRTPLNAIIGYAQMLIDGFSGELVSEQRADVQTIADSADKLLNMVEDALDLARIDAERFPVYMDTLAFDEVVRRAISSVRSESDKKGLHLESRISEEAPVVRTDPDRVRQILSNLLSNAVKFTEQGSIHISVERDEMNGVRFNVTDTGIGFDVTSFPQIFDEFSQLDASTTRVHGGSGLGLAVSKRLVQRLGGQIGVHSTPGEGSTFWFRLPLEIPGAET